MIIRFLVQVFLLATKLATPMITFPKICSHFIMSSDESPSSFKIRIRSNLVKRGIERPVLTYKSNSGSYF